jgi:hypothetical protein
LYRKRPGLMLEADLVRAAIFPIMVTGTIWIWRKGRYIAGRLLVLIGTLHLIGFWVGREPLLQMLRAGLIGEADSAVGSLPAKTDQELVFWFLLWGVVTIVQGQLVILLERHGVSPPAWFGWELVLLNLACAALMPKGGFWWVLLPAALIVRGSGRHTACKRL